MLHQPFGLQMKLSHHIYELRTQFEEDSAYFTFNNSPSHFIYNVNNHLVAALGRKHQRPSEDVGRGGDAGQPVPGPTPPRFAPLSAPMAQPCQHPGCCPGTAPPALRTRPGG